MSKSEEIENKIIEKRTLEANKKGLMGKNGKLGTILKILGQPIINQSAGGGLLDSNYIDLEGNSEQIDLLELRNSEELMQNIPIMNVSGNSRPDTDEWKKDMPDPIDYGIETIGLHFDGLNRGMHLEIKYDDITSELVVYYKGHVAYKEIKGELLGYAPNEEWEKWIDSLYKIAKEKQRNLKEKEFEELIKQNEREKTDWWEKIKNKWGIN